jgi:outer membrane putative beta-barrel porin/alpha-amylase
VRVAAWCLGTACWAVILTTSVAPAAESERIQTDRPSVSTSTYVVQPGALQIESGVEYSRTSIGGSPAERQLTLDVTLRAGVTEHLELRLDGEPVVVLRGAQDDTGWGDVSLEAKYRFFDGREGRWWPSLGLLPIVKFPTAHAPHGTNVPDFGLTGLASFVLPAGFSLDANLGVNALAQRPSGYLAQGVGSASLGHDLGERWSVYAEVFFSSAAERGARSSVGFDTGLEFLLTPTLALDAAVQTSLAGPGPDYAFRAGLSVRFGR